jgi:transcription factor E
MAKKKSKKPSKASEPKKTVEDSQIVLLKSIVEDLIGKQSIPIIDLLAGKKPVNEFSIAESLKLTINQTRNILYKLSDLGLVSFTRKKDKRKGWYIYFWTLNAQQSILLLEEKLKNKLKELKNQLRNRKMNRYYSCSVCSTEVNEEAALLNNFTCPECTTVYQLVDDTEHVKNIEREMAKISKELTLVSEEVKKQKEKQDKEKGRKIVREEREKKEKRKMARLKRMAEKKKLIKETEKKKAPKKKKQKKTVKKRK